MLNRLDVQLVGPDGCFVLHGLRVRAAPGWHLETGSLADEAARGVRTPLAGQSGKRDVLACCSRNLHRFVESLPVAELRPTE